MEWKHFMSGLNPFCIDHHWTREVCLSDCVIRVCKKCEQVEIYEKRRASLFDKAIFRTFRTY